MNPETTTETTETVESTATVAAEVSPPHPPVGADATREELLKRYEKAVADNAKYREREAARKQELEAKDGEVAAHLEAKTQAELQANIRVAKADFRARLRSEGISDPDVLKLVDFSSVEFDADGDPTNADEVWAKFQESKPYLFAGKPAVDTSTTSVHKAPSDKSSQIDWNTAPAEMVKAAMKPSRFKP